MRLSIESTTTTPGGIPEQHRSRNVGADAVALDDAAGRAVQQRDTALAVGRDHVAGPGRRSADHVAGRKGHEDTVEGVRYRLGPRDVGAEEVAPHHVLVRLDDADGVLAVAGDDVALGVGGSADEGVRCRVDGHPSLVFWSATAPVESTPMKLPRIVLRSDESFTLMPAVCKDATGAVARDHVAGGGVLPPTRLRTAPSRRIPSASLDRAIVPVGSVPMKLPRWYRCRQS